MQMLGRLGAGIAHDFNNVLAVIMSTMEYLRSLPADAPLSQQEVSECIEDVMAAAEHGAGVVSRITATLRRRSPGSMEVVDLSSVCQDTVRLVSRTFPRSMHVEQDIEPSLFVRAEAGALHQLVLNLCINARDAMQDQGCLRVRIQGKSGCELVGMPLDTTGQYCALSVEDTGPGMDEYTAQHVFEPLFTTKHTGGTGLGLSTVQEIARAHGGHIEVDSSVGYGTRVTVYLPRTEAAPEDPDPKADDPDPVKPGRGRGQSGDERKPRIVLVDDEELVVKSTARLLRRAGFEVEVALGGRPAIRLIQEDKQFDLVVLDFDMPDLSGEACHRELNQIAPGLRTVYLSGHADADREQVARELGALAFVRKPCDSTDLVATLRAALSAGSPASNSTTS
jgi:CheY-like chemotaxis protein